MSSLKTLDRQPFETLLEMGGGYVLDLTNQSFASLIAETVNKDVYAERYTKYGDSKAKRLRAFWDLESDTVVGKVLAELLDLWEYEHPQPTAEQTTLLKRCRAIVGRLLGEPASVDTTERDFLRREFKDISMAKVPIESNLIPILEARFNEATACLEGKAPLAAIFMCGSILEGLLLGTALSNPKQFNQASRARRMHSARSRRFRTGRSRS